MRTRATKDQLPSHSLDKDHCKQVMTFEETFGSVRLTRPSLTFKQMRDIAIDDHVKAIIAKLRRY